MLLPCHPRCVFSIKGVIWQSQKIIVSLCVSAWYVWGFMCGWCVFSPMSYCFKFSLFFTPLFSMQIHKKKTQHSQVIRNRVLVLQKAHSFGVSKNQIFPKELGNGWTHFQWRSSSVFSWAGLHTVFGSSHQQGKIPSTVLDTFSIHRIPATHRRFK